MGWISSLGTALAPRSIAQAFRSTPRIGRRGPPLAQPMPLLSGNVTLVDKLALDKDLDLWLAVMERADRGDTGPMIDVFSDARDYDSHLDGVIRKRVQQMTARPIVFHPPVGLENDADANDIAARTRRILLTESYRFRSMITHLMTGAAYSYAVSPIEWTTNTRGEFIPHLQWQHPNRFGFDRDTLELGFYKSKYRGDWRVCPLSEYPDSFVAHVPMGGRSDYPWRRGPVRSCIIPSFLKRHGLSFWLVLTERFGMPQLWATVPEGMDHDGQSSTATIAVVQAALQNVSKTWAATFGKGIEINALPGSGSINSDTHKALIDWAEMTMSIAVLGQNLSTKVEGGSFAAAEAHRDVAGVLHLADAIELGETITQQLIEPLVRYNWPGAPVPVCEITTGQRLAFEVEHVKEGIASADELRGTMGHEAIPGGRGAGYRRTVAVPEQIGDEDEPTTTPGQEPEAGAAIETEPAASTEATVKDPSTGLNGAQLAEAKQLLLDVGAGLLPKDTAKQLLLASLPFSPEQVGSMLDPIVVTVSAEPAPSPVVA